jgi:hypothetical protein
MKFVAALLCAVSLAFGVTAAAAAEGVTPVEGRWSATTSAGLPVSFEVREGQAVDARFKFHWGFCGVFESALPMSVGIDPTGHWKYLDSRGPWVEGTFLAPDRAEGLVVAPSRELPGCPRTEATYIAAPGEPAPTEKPDVLVEDNVVTGHLAKRPHKIVLSANESFYLYAVRWQSFGGSVARATATTYTRNGCRTCRHRDVERPRVTLKLTGLRRRGNDLIYARLHFVLHGPIPAGFARRGSQSML